jgi:hypothetical protein
MGNGGHVRCMHALDCFYIEKKINRHYCAQQQQGP